MVIYKAKILKTGKFGVQKSRFLFFLKLFLKNKACCNTIQQEDTANLYNHKMLLLITIC
jgi:hypothetical protein